MSDHLPIRVIGMRPAAAVRSVAPAGIHLRWSFPPGWGFPAGGFRVNRRRAEGIKPRQVASWTALTGQTLPGSTVLQGVTLAVPAANALLVSPDGLLRAQHVDAGSLLELRFSAPVAILELTFERPQRIEIAAFAGGSPVIRHVVESAPGPTSVRFAYPGIDRLTIPMTFGALRQLGFTTVQDVLDGQDAPWQGTMANLPLIATEAAAINRLEATLRNRYAANRVAAVDRYRPHLHGLLEWLWMLQQPAAAPFIDAAAPPYLLELPSSLATSPLKRVRPQSMLLLAALDPNIARFLSLYWVDVDGMANGPAARTAYDYKVRGLWPAGSDGAGAAGLALDVGREPSQLPRIRGPVTALQLDGTRWRNRQPLVDVGLSWPEPPRPARIPSDATRAVLFDTVRESRGTRTLLTEDAPGVVPRHASAPLFVDEGVVLGQYRYEIRGIDIFGQVGDWVISDAIDLVDRLAPPPPVRVSASAPARPTAVSVGFEYGASLSEQAPDAARFQMFTRADTLVERRDVKVTVLQRQVLEDGSFIHEIRLTEPDGSPLAPGLSTSWRSASLDLTTSGTAKLAARARLHARIGAVRGGDRVRLEPLAASLSDGPASLRSDPHAKATWREVGPSVPVRPPVTGGSWRSRMRSTSGSELSPGRTPASRFRHCRPGKGVPPRVR